MTRRLHLALALTCACGLPDVTVVGAHVEVAADPGHQLCGGSLAHMDRLVERLSTAFSVVPPSGEERIRFYWLDEDDFHARSNCPERRSGCAIGLTAFSTHAPHEHELVHNVGHRIGLAPPFFTEGLAVAFEGLGSGPSRGASSELAPTDVVVVEEASGGEGAEPPGLDVRDLLDLSSVELGDIGGYPVAGAFTAFLIRTHGLDRHVRLFAALNRVSGRRAIDREFRDVFGVSLEQSIVDFDAAARACGAAEFDAKLLECAAPELAWDGVALVHNRVIACAQDDVIGPYYGGLVVLYTVELAEAGEYELRVVDDGGSPSDAPSPFAVSLVGCGGCGAKSLVAHAGAPPQVGWLDAGRYSLRMHGVVGTPRSLGFRLARLADP